MNRYIQKDSVAYLQAISALFLGSFVTFALMYCTQPLIPEFSREFGLAPSYASLSVSVTTGAVALSTLAVAGLSEFMGRKLTMALALMGAAISTIAAAFVNDFTLLLIIRALQGVMLAGYPAIAMAYVNEEFDPCITGLVMGIYVSGTSIGGLSGRMIVSALTDYFSWQIALGCMGIVSVLISAWFLVRLPRSRHFTPGKRNLRSLASSLMQHLHNSALRQLYFIGFSIMGTFVAIYNYIGFPLLSPPYNLSQTAIGGLFLIYLVGTFSSTFMGKQADKFSHAKVLCVATCIMLVGSLITLAGSLALKVAGLAILTFGFFGSHSVVSSWIGKCTMVDKAQASSLYLFFYYVGASVIGTAGGVFLHIWGWEGVIFLVGIVLGAALFVSVSMLYHEPFNSAAFDKHS